MSDLQPCPQCRRHVRVDERACPFCTATLPAAAGRALPGGRLTRAAVFAGAALASACGGAQSQPATPTDQPTAAADAAVAEQPATEPDAATPTYVPPPDHDVPMPYGAPPSRARLV